MTWPPFGGGFGGIGQSIAKKKPIYLYYGIDLISKFKFKVHFLHRFSAFVKLKYLSKMNIFQNDNFVAKCIQAQLMYRKNG